MAWVELAESGEPYNFESSGNAKVSGSVVFPDGAAARNATWFIELTDPTKRLGFTWVTVVPVALPNGSSLNSPGGLIDANGMSLQGYTLSGGFVTTATVAQAPENVSPSGSATFSYEPPEVSNESFVPPHYNIVVWVEVDSPGPGPEPGPIGPCEEIGRATRNHVSAYQRDRVFQASLFANERRCLVTNFNGAIPPGRTIARAVWQTLDQSQCVMSLPAINGREVQAMVSAQYQGRCRIRVDVTLDNGEIYSAWHVIRIQPAPMFNNPGWATGPSRLEVVV